MAVAIPYCTQAQMQRFFSAAGILAFADHDQDGLADADVITDCIDQATEEINLYALQKYDASTLATSTLIARWCTVLATYFLCERRGNPVPESIGAEAARIQAKLEQIPKGGLTLPGLATRSDFRPLFSNMTVDRRYPHSPVRVDQYASDGPPSELPTKQLTVGVPFLE